MVVLGLLVVLAVPFVGALIVLLVVVLLVLSLSDVVGIAGLGSKGWLSALTSDSKLMNISAQRPTWIRLSISFHLKVKKRK